MDWLSTLFLHYPGFTYPLLFIATIIEGTITPLVAGALIKIGFFNVFLAWGVGFLGESCHDTLFWWIGRRLRTLHKSKYLFVNLSGIEEKLEKLSTSMPWYVFASKFTWHFNRVVLVSAGYAKFPYKKFLTAALPAAFLWVPISLGIGYFFADQTQLFHQRIEVAGIIVGLGLIIIISIQLFFSRIVRSVLSFSAFITRNGKDKN
jgi:membrane protein DedA with SNARE-associated domain